MLGVRCRKRIPPRIRETKEGFIARIKGNAVGEVKLQDKPS